METSSVIVRDAVGEHMTDNSLYSEYPHGFWEHRPCVTQLLEVLEDCTQLIDNGYPIAVVYLDFKKHFILFPIKD